jgi:hypothetical protein
VQRHGESHENESPKRQSRRAHAHCRRGQKYAFIPIPGAEFELEVYGTIQCEFKAKNAMRGETTSWGRDNQNEAVSGAAFAQQQQQVNAWSENVIIFILTCY